MCLPHHSSILGVIFAAGRGKPLDLESVEMATRAGMHRAGAAVLSNLLDSTSHTPEDRCPCGHQASYHDTRSRHLLTALGEVEIRRCWYVCPQCGQGHSPRDRELGIEATDVSPAVRRMLAVVGSETSFEHGREQLELLAGLEVTAKAVERQAEAIGTDIEAREQNEIRRAKQLDLPSVCISEVAVLYIEMDGTGVPVVRAETEGRKGKTAGEPARTREVKLGCVFTQTTTDDEGRPVRDDDSTSYVGAIENAEAFGLRLYNEAWRRGWSRAKLKVILADGAVWIWNLAAIHFPGAVQIVDIYHARQHLFELAGRLLPADEKQRKRWLARCLDRLDQGKIEALVNILRGADASSQEMTAVLATEADYFERNAERMRYPKFRAKGLFIGSGVIEAGCRTAIGARLKRSGMFWSVAGANAIIALRCCRLSNRFEDYWADRICA